MSEEQQNTSGINEGEQPSIQLHVDPNLEYVYRDIFNVYAGSGDVLIEFGNLHRAMPGHASISNRIVVSMSDAYVLVRTMQDALQKAQAMMQQQLAQRNT